jgi:nucleoid DNA-binding protein
VIDRALQYAYGRDLSRADVERVYKEMTKIIIENTKNNEPTFMPDFGVFGVRTWRRDLNADRTKADFGTYQTPVKNTWSEGKPALVGADTCKIIFRATGRFKEALK